MIIQRRTLARRALDRIPEQRPGEGIEHKAAEEPAKWRAARVAAVDRVCESDLAPGEGVFLPCSFWLADNYTLQNRDAEASALFERLLSLCNDVGLLAEEYDPQAQRQVGNFPQAFSHLALIGTALSLHDIGPAQQRRQGAKAGS
jgi:hypothetical protein